MMRTVLLAACMAGVHALSKDRLHSFWGFANEVEVPNESDASYPFEGVGPYGTRIWRPESQGLRWRLTVTLPAALPVAPDDADISLTTRMPVVFLFNGFMTKASWYAAVRDHLASWGYIIVQYDTPRWRIPSISDELEEFPVILSWLERENQREGSPLHGRVNTSCIATAGHSRGGKLACLLYTKYESIQSAWLIDPVDGLDRAAPSEDNPSALHALEASSRKRIGISGAGILSSCNAGKEGNFVSFYNSSGHGSWVATLPQASHSSFADGGSIINLLQDIVCGKSRIKRKLVEKINTAMMLTWFQITLDGPPQGVPDPILKFRSWIERVQDQEGLVNFEVKSPKLEYQLA